METSEPIWVRSRGRLLGPFDADRLRADIDRGLISTFDSASTDRQSWQTLESLLSHRSGTGGIASPRPAPLPSDHDPANGARPTAASGANGDPLYPIDSTQPAAGSTQTTPDSSASEATIDVAGSASDAASQQPAEEPFASDWPAAPRSRRDTPATVLAWMGLLIAPLAVTGLIWGAMLTSQTNGRKGRQALVVGFTFTMLWAIGLIAVLGSR